MRLIAGQFKGIRLESPDTMETRPTAERARENLFNILAYGKFSRCLRGGKIVDIFAGTGAVGLEAMSRGASEVIFFEQAKSAVTSLANNIKKCKISNRSRIITGDALAPPRAAKAADFLFFDPPYYGDLATRSVLAFDQTGWIAEQTLLVVQIHPGDKFQAPPGFILLDERKYGATRFLFLEKKNPQIAPSRQQGPHQTNQRQADQ